tara:strand:+ start:2373 stop:2912 length:540 start_codon:yes stop_codon:yes gene_type:complete
MKLFAVFLGGRAKKCNTELHDVVFTCGDKIEETYFDLISKWFGIPDRLHIDSWVELSYVDGYKITLSQLKNNSNNKLYFINLGGYEPKKFEELHESKFMVGRDKKNIKIRAKESMLVGLEQVHTDDLYDVDDCIEINKVSNLYVNLIESKIKKELRFNNGYLPIPKKIIDQYKSLNGID